MSSRDYLKEVSAGLQNSGTDSLKGKTRMFLFIFASDVLFSSDVTLLRLLNSSYHGLDILDINEAMRETIKLLKENTVATFIDFDILDSAIRIKPLVENKFDSTDEFFLWAKKDSKFILKPIFKKYFSDISLDRLTYNIMMNPNASGLLRTDANHIVYDDTDPVSIAILNEFTRMFHKDKCIPLSKLHKFIADKVVERDSMMDFIVSDLHEFRGPIAHKIVDELDRVISDGILTENEVRERFTTASVISGITQYNIKELSTINSENTYSIGLTKLFTKQIL